MIRTGTIDYVLTRLDEEENDIEYKLEVDYEIYRGYGAAYFEYIIAYLNGNHFVISDYEEQAIADYIFDRLN